MNEEDRKLLLQYFENIIPYSPVETMDEGIGTIYERLVLEEWFKKVMNNYGLESVLEFPCDGITGLLGINSLIFMKHGKRVTLCNPSLELLKITKRIWNKLGYPPVEAIFTSEDAPLPFPENTFDLVWNFCMMERYGDPSTLVKEMKRVSRKFVLIMTQNWHNWGTYPHSLYHKYKGKPWDHGYKRYMTMNGIKKMIRNADLSIVEEGGIDIPPIIDTWDTPIRGTLQSVLKLAGRHWEWKQNTNRETSSKIISLFYTLERNLPEFFKKYQAHHLYILASKGS